MAKTMTARQIATTLGVSIGLVYVWLRKSGVKAVPDKVGRRCGTQKGVSPKWLTVDWTLQDTVLAPRLGVCRERVRQMRRRLGKPNAVRHMHPTRATKGDVVAKYLAENPELSGNVTAGEVASMFGVSPWIVWRAANGSFQFARAKATDPRFDLMNYSLPSATLARLWRIEKYPSQLTPSTAIIATRARRGHPKPKWILNYGGGEKELLETDAEFAFLYAEEKAKADAYFATQDAAQPQGV